MIRSKFSKYKFFKFLSFGNLEIKSYNILFLLLLLQYLFSLGIIWLSSSIPLNRNLGRIKTSMLYGGRVLVQLSHVLSRRHLSFFPFPDSNVGRNVNTFVRIILVWKIVPYHHSIIMYEWTFFVSYFFYLLWDNLALQICKENDQLDSSNLIV